MNKLKLFLLDMDGTLYLENQLFEGVLEFLEHIKSIGGRYMFLTNNSSKGIDTYLEKLAKLGIPATKDDFMTSTDATVLYLKNMGYKKIYAFGTESFKAQLKKEGLNITDEREDGIDCLCMANDQELTFQKLEDSCILLKQDIAYVATNPDWVCPTWYGYVPDCGSVAEMLYNATKKRPVFIGKPEPQMAYLAMQRTGFKPHETVIIGDRLYTDIACGVNAGITSVFVLSGEGTLKDLEESEKKPTFVYKNVKEFLKDLKNN